MRRMLTMCAVVAALSAVAMAETYAGRLIDATCYDQQQGQKNVMGCDPTANTTIFALFSTGKVIKLDDDGNSKAAAALKDRADRSTDPGKPANTVVTARVTGSIEGERLKVDKIEVQ